MEKLCPTGGEVSSHTPKSLKSSLLMSKSKTTNWGSLASKMKHNSLSADKKSLSNTTKRGETGANYTLFTSNSWSIVHSACYFSLNKATNIQLLIEFAGRHPTNNANRNQEHNWRWNNNASVRYALDAAFSINLLSAEWYADEGFRTFDITEAYSKKRALIDE